MRDRADTSRILVVERVISFTPFDGGFAHIHIGDLACVACERRNRQRTRVSKQIQDILARCVLNQPLSERCHVKKQSGILVNAGLDFEVDPVLCHHTMINLLPVQGD